MSRATPEDLRLIDELQARYVDALDRKDMPGWLAAFGAEGQYICTTAESEESKWSIALIMDDCRGRLEDRVKFVDKIWAGTYQDYQTRHLVTRIESTAVSDGVFGVRSNFVVAFTRSDTGRTEVFATGVYHDRVQVGDGQACFRAKKVVTDAPMLPHYMVYPL
jgi:3-phenylpropionate/cinnamic acid dioxygenase small subunit